MICPTDLCPVYTSVVSVLTYYSIFDYPLTAREIHQFLPDGGIDQAELASSLDDFVANGMLQYLDGYYLLPDQPIAIVERRIGMERQGEKMWRIARRAASLMRHAPFVRGIFISGQLCRYIADAKSDIDFFIITEPERLWIVRTLFVAVRRLLLFNSRRYFCVNFYVTTDNLVIREHNLYTANEVASLKPMHNLELFHRFLCANQWIKEYYPNFDISSIELRPRSPEGSRLRYILERLTPVAFAKRIDLRLLGSTRAFWHLKYPEASEEFHNTSLRSRRNESRAHPQDRSPIVLELYTARLRTYGICDD